MRLSVRLAPLGARQKLLIFTGGYDSTLIVWLPVLIVAPVPRTGQAPCLYIDSRFCFSNAASQILSLVMVIANTNSTTSNDPDY